MKRFFNLFFLCLALCLAASVGASPSPVPNDIQSAVDQVDMQSTHHTFNVAVPFGQPGDTIETRGFDPSQVYRQRATVEVWTGGSLRTPVNFGDLRGSNLSDKVFSTLDAACPWSGEAGDCKDNSWKTFWTNALIRGDPDWIVEPRKVWIKTQSASFANQSIRVVLMQIVADTLRAYTNKASGYNCYDVPGNNNGIYCNVPQFVRVNLPECGANWPKNGFCTSPNHWHIETWGTDYNFQFSNFGELRPCKTRSEVDKVMDKYKDDLLRMFPEWIGRFHRDARVIIDGFKVCSTEP